LKRDSVRTTVDRQLGFSLGGFIAQVIAQKHPDLVRRMILAGTSAAGGEGVSNVAAVLQNAVAKATAEKKHPKQARHSCFFSLLLAERLRAAPLGDNLIEQGVQLSLGRECILRYLDPELYCGRDFWLTVKPSRIEHPD
jgi:pimeloyl-ACP methyl ester carboxylesterase